MAGDTPNLGFEIVEFDVDIRRAVFSSISPVSHDTSSASDNLDAERVCGRRC
jgi:hypothetical protein